MPIVSERALRARINRKLAHDGERLYTPRYGSNEFLQYGPHMVVDGRNVVTDWGCDLESLDTSNQFQQEQLIERAIKLHYKVLEREGFLAMHPSQSFCEFDVERNLIFICNGSDILTVFRYNPQRDRMHLVTKHSFTRGAYGRIERARGAA